MCVYICIYIVTSKPFPYQLQTLYPWLKHPLQKIRKRFKPEDLFGIYQADATKWIRLTEAFLSQTAL